MGNRPKSVMPENMWPFDLLSYSFYRTDQNCKNTLPAYRTHMDSRKAVALIIHTQRRKHKPQHASTSMRTEWQDPATSTAHSAWTILPTSRTQDARYQSYHACKKLRISVARNKERTDTTRPHSFNTQLQHTALKVCKQHADAATQLLQV